MSYRTPDGELTGLPSVTTDMHLPSRPRTPTQPTDVSPRRFDFLVEPSEDTGGEYPSYKGDVQITQCNRWSR